MVVSEKPRKIFGLITFGSWSFFKDKVASDRYRFHRWRIGSYRYYHQKMTESNPPHELRDVL